MPATPAIRELLRTSQVVSTFSTGTFAHNPVRDRAKVVVYVADGTPVYAVLPEPLTINLERLLSLTGAVAIRPAREEEVFGAATAEPIVVDVRLALSQEIVFTTDTAAETVAIRWAEFARSVRPIVGDFAETPRDRVGAYRLSYRE